MITSVFIIVGLFVGFCDALLMGDRGYTTISDLIIGVIGAFLGGWMVPAESLENYSFWSQVFTAGGGAVILLVIANIFRSIFRPGKV